MAVTFTDNSYVGSVFEDFLVAMVSANRTVQEGHVHVESGINKKLFIPSLDVTGNIIQPWQNSVPTESGTTVLTERSITPTDLMIYTKFTPNEFRDYWDFSQPSSSTALIFTELPEVFRNAMQNYIIRKSAFSVAQTLWLGDAVTSPAPSYPLNLFSGWIYRALNDSAVIDISGATTLTALNVEDELDSVYQSVPDSIVFNPSLKMFVSIKTGKLMQAASNAISGKGTTFLQVNGLNDMSYNGVSVIALAEVPDDIILCTIADTSEDSNLWFGVTNASDANAGFNDFRIDRVDNSGEIWFIKSSMGIGTEIVRPSEVVLYDGR
jgi:hypothetical protein